MHKLNSRGDPSFGEDVTEVELDRLCADDEALGNAAIGQALDDQAAHGQLLGGQSGRCEVSSAPRLQAASSQLSLGLGHEGGRL
jgi:hypothetical protein